MKNIELKNKHHECNSSTLKQHKIKKKQWTMTKTKTYKNFFFQKRAIQTCNSYKINK